jgi:osmotically-inducible protein OsmY
MKSDPINRSSGFSPPSEGFHGLNEDQIIAQVRAALEKDLRINLHRHPIDLAFDAGDLVLSGEAETVAAKKLALQSASQIHGPRRVIDRLRVKPSDRLGDAEIRDHFSKLLLQEPALERCQVRASVAGEVNMFREIAGEPGFSILFEVLDGVITLNGNVPSLSHKRLAGLLAWWTPGCRDAINGLEEIPPEDDNDDELTDAVRLALEKDPFVDATEIRTTTNDAVVTLEGWVPNETAKQMAERDTWYVLGVKDVINQLQDGV